MVFKRKIKSKRKEYWVLIHSIRKGKRIIHKSKYIGKTLPPKERLEQLDVIVYDKLDDLI